MTQYVKRTLNRARGKAHRATTYLRHPLHLGQNCPHTNLYHCSVQKTASQWVKRIFRSVYNYSGLDLYGFSEMPEVIQNLRITRPFPLWTAVTQLYIDYSTYREIPKRGTYRTLYMLRDPRDIVVSWYFSTLYSHTPIGYIPRHRADLSAMSVAEGLVYSIEQLDYHGQFKAQRSWITQCDDPLVKILRYENLAIDEALFLGTMFEHCDISVPPAVIPQLVEEHGFKALAGREQGQEDIKQPYRKGVAGDWKNHFDETVTRQFKQCVGDLVTVLGYEKTENW